MLLCSLYSAAVTAKPELLPNCPIQPLSTIKTILDALPKLTIIRDAVHISSVLATYHPDAEKLISWACTQYRGYIASASGLCKIKNLPTGTHQFVLANASPALEAAYISRLPKPSSQTTVLFHGTSLDRLPAILAKGLIVCSGTSLQRTGCVYGKGIYMAEDPSVSFSYAPVNSTWRNSSLANMRVMLGCEVVGKGRSVTSGIHVITDEASVMVRYIFFVSPECYCACGESCCYGYGECDGGVEDGGCVGEMGREGVWCRVYFCLLKVAAVSVTVDV
jgi:hypothetical protein